MVVTALLLIFKLAIEELMLAIVLTVLFKLSVPAPLKPKATPETPVTVPAIVKTPPLLLTLKIGVLLALKLMGLVTISVLKPTSLKVELPFMVKVLLFAKVLPPRFKLSVPLLESVIVPPVEEPKALGFVTPKVPLFTAIAPV